MRTIVLGPRRKLLRRRLTAGQLRKLVLRKLTPGPRWKTGRDPDSLASDAREARMDRVATLYGEITSATREFLAALAESDRHRDWAEEGFGSCAEWLAWRIGVSKNTASEKVRTARALEGLPLISEAMARGQVSFTKVRALTRAARPESEAELLELARSASAAKLERVIRSWKLGGRGDEARRERMRQESRTFSVFPDGEGMYVVQGRLMPEAAAMLMRAVEAASDALFRAGAETESEEGGEAGDRDGEAARDALPGSGAETENEAERSEENGNAAAGGKGEKREPERSDPEGLPVARQRRADALALVAERALAAGFTEGAPVSGTRAARYQVMLHVDRKTLREHSEPGVSELEDGTRLSAETARRLCCDTSLVEVHMARGRILDVGRRTRTIPPSLRRALEVRDRGCRFPGCGVRFTDAHHIVHWADNGPTSLKNCLLLCARHHRRVHEGGWMVASDKDGRQVVFFTPKGKGLFDAPRETGQARDALGGKAGVSAAADEARGSADDADHSDSPPSNGAKGLDASVMASAPASAPPSARLRARLAERGIRPDHASCGQRYRHDRFVPWQIETAAMQAPDRADDAEEGMDPSDDVMAAHDAEAAKAHSTRESSSTSADDAEAVEDPSDESDAVDA